MTQVSWPALRDVWLLGKPRLSLLVFFTTGVGLAAAPHAMGAARAWSTLLLVALVVFGANGVNSYLERDADSRMHRTQRRPLPAGRIEPLLALAISLGAAGGATALLFRVAGPLPALLAFFAFASYVWLYTPMKRVHWGAVLVGAVPGAIPPMLGWAAAEGTIDAGAWSLFALLFVWQLPHFFAIALCLEDDYRRGGLVVLPHVVGAPRTRQWTLVTALLLVPASVLPCFYNGASWLYGSVALASSAAFVWLCTGGVRHTPPDARWARKAFVASILHMTILLLALLIDGAWRLLAGGVGASS